MYRSPSRAFTLIELLVVITIIGVLVGIALPVFSSMQLAAKRTQSMSNLRQLTIGTIAYCNDNNGNLPQQGDGSVTWSQAASTTSAEMSNWYNVVPRTYCNSRGVGDYAANTAAFYAKGSMFYVPAGKYPPSSIKLATPQFALAFNSKLNAGGATNTRLQMIQLPAETVLYLECGLSGETVIKGESAYTNSSYAYASSCVARYNGQTILTFADGHAGIFSGPSVVDPSSGKAYFQPYPTAFPAGAAKIYWEVSPTVNPN